MIGYRSKPMLNGAKSLIPVALDQFRPGGAKFRAGSSRTGFVRLYNAHVVDSQAQTIVAQDVAQSPVDSGQSVPMADSAIPAACRGSCRRMPMDRARSRSRSRLKARILGF